MRHRLPPLNAIKAFEASARHLNMSEAAEELGVSQSAVSQQVRSLEKWFGADLYERVGGRIVLTATGKTLARASTDALDLLAETIHALELENGPQHLSIRVEPAFGAKWMRRRLNALKDYLGQVEIDMWTNHSVPAKFPEQTDLLIHYGALPKWPNVESVRILDLCGFPACSPDLLAKHGSLETPEDIGRFHLLHGEERETWRGWLEQNDIQSVSHMSGTLYDDFGLTIEAAIDGEGVLIADPILCERELAEGLLVPLWNTEVFCTSYFLSAKKASLQRAVVRKMRDWIVTEVGKSADALSLSGDT